MSFCKILAYYAFRLQHDKQLMFLANVKKIRHTLNLKAEFVSNNEIGQVLI